MEAGVNGKKYIQTPPEEWTKVNDNNRRNIKLLFYTDSNKDFTLHITAVKIAAMKDTFSGIHFNKVTEHLLPQFRGVYIKFDLFGRSEFFFQKNYEWNHNNNRLIK